MTLTNEDIVRLVGAGVCCAQIARDAGVSRQAVHQRIQKLVRSGGIQTSLPTRRMPGRPSDIVVEGTTARVSLTQGMFAIVDAGDVKAVSRFKWRVSVGARGHRYAVTWDGGARVLMHRLLTGAPDGMVVDHVDGDGINNRRENMRVCTQAQNVMNRTSALHQSGRKGLRHDPQSGHWGARVAVSGKRPWLGTFKTEAEARAAYNEAAQKLHGEFALLNGERPLQLK